MRLGRSLLIALAAAGAAAAVSHAQIADDDDPRLRVVVRAGDRLVRAQAGDFCLQTKGGGRGCADAVVDVDRLPRIRIGPGEEVEFRPATTASLVRVHWGRVLHDGRVDVLEEVGRVDAAPVEGTDGKRWRVVLPRRARRSPYLRILVRYGSRVEWVSFHVGIRIRRPARTVTKAVRNDARLTLSEVRPRHRRAEREKPRGSRASREWS